VTDMSTSCKTTIASDLARKIRDGILRGLYAPGEKLGLDRLGTAYGVSLSPVREALLRLSGEGFVLAEEQKGFRVAPTSLANLEEVTLLRAQLEPLALSKAIERGDLAWEERLVSIAYRLKRIEERDGYVPFLDEWEQAHHDFHLTLIAGSGMPLLVQFCSTLHDHSDRYRRLYLETLPPQRNVGNEHTEIVEAALSRDATRACALLRQHCERTGLAVQAFMKTEPGAKSPGLAGSPPSRAPSSASDARNVEELL